MREYEFTEIVWYCRYDGTWNDYYRAQFLDNAPQSVYDFMTVSVVPGIFFVSVSSRVRDIRVFREELVLECMFFRSPL